MPSICANFRKAILELITAMGDVVSICARSWPVPQRSSPPAQAGRRFCFPPSITTWPRSTIFIDAGNLDALGDFIHTGQTQWLTKNVHERFPVHMFTPQQIDSLVKSKGFEIISRIGKTIIPGAAEP